MAKTNVEQVSYADLAETTIEEIRAPENTFDEQEIDREQELDRAEIEPSELAQEDAMDGGYFDGSIPDDMSAPPGLSPMRAELVRFFEWRRRTATEIEHLEEAHHRAVEALGGETTTKKKIDALIEADVGAVLKFALGGEAITATKLRAFERHQLEQKLKADRHAAQVASETLQQIEPRPFADRDQGGREQRPERNAHAWTDQPLLDRVAHQKDAAERERDAANPNHPAGAEPFLKTDRLRRRRRRSADGRHGRRRRQWRRQLSSGRFRRCARRNFCGFGCWRGRRFSLRRRRGRRRRRKRC
jgi:hypothetical protein